MFTSRNLLLFALLIFLASCSPVKAPSAQVQVPDINRINHEIPAGFVEADGSHVLTFPQDFGAHEDFRTEWWYYTGNLQTAEGSLTPSGLRPERGQHFGFELTIFRVGLLPPTAELPNSSKWYGHSVYFAHFAVSDIGNNKFYAFERYSRPGPGLAGAQAQPYRVWLEDWNITEQEPGKYRLQAEQEGVKIDLSLTDEIGVILQGQNGYSRKGKSPNNASYYFSQPRLGSEGSVQINGQQYEVAGLTWMDHEFSTSALDPDQIGWDWFSLQFDDGPALMLFQLRQKDGKISDASSGTYIDAQGKSKYVDHTSFEITVQDTWHSPHTQAIYPAAWQIHLSQPNCQLQAKPWMADQELHFPAVTYWEGAVHFEGTCDGAPVQGNGYIELTGYGGKVPLP